MLPDVALPRESKNGSVALVFLASSALLFALTGFATLMISTNYNYHIEIINQSTFNENLSAPI